MGSSRGAAPRCWTAPRCGPRACGTGRKAARNQPGAGSKSPQRWACGGSGPRSWWRVGDSSGTLMGTELRREPPAAALGKVPLGPAQGKRPRGGKPARTGLSYSSGQKNERSDRAPESPGVKSHTAEAALRSAFPSRAREPAGAHGRASTQSARCRRRQAEVADSRLPAAAPPDRAAGRAPPREAGGRAREGRGPGSAPRSLEG